MAEKYPLEQEQKDLYSIIMTSLEKGEYEFCIRAIAMFKWVEEQKLKLPGFKSFGVSTVTTIEKGLEAEGYFASKMSLTELLYV